MHDAAWTTIGNEPVLRALSAALKGEPAHAYLFAGRDGLGRGRTALEFAAALNCTGDVRPCRQCRSCRDTFAGNHPDVEWLAPGGLCDEPEHRGHAESRDIRICQVRRLERVLSLAPYSGGWRVAVIENAHTLTGEAANAFLKTLEEPPRQTVLVLLTDREDELPETVLSRCQRLAFHAVDREAVRRALEAEGADSPMAERIARIAGGRIGWALRALAEPALLEQRETFLAEAVQLAHAARSERFAWAARAADRDLSVRRLYADELDVWQGWWRDVLAVLAGAVGGIVNVDKKSLLDEESRLYTAPQIVLFLRSLTVTRGYLEQNVDPQLALENLMLDLPQPAAGAIRSQ
jgi:DNA polymerase-3 subunit delta'